MKHSSIFFILVCMTVSVIGQNNKTVTVDTFYFGQKLSHRVMIIRSDSTYCIRTTGCTFAYLNMGFWKKDQDVYSLTGLNKLTIVAKTEVYPIENSEDSIVMFKVEDCYGNPISEYYIDLYTSGFSFDTTAIYNKTDAFGTLRINKNRFKLYNTETDDTNREDVHGGFNDISYRPILQNAKKILITLCFPKTTVPQLSADNFYLYDAEKFQLKNNELLELKSRIKYIKK